MYIASINGISTEMLEAARVDGSSKLQVCIRIIVPLVKSTTLYLSVTTIISILKLFVIIQLLKEIFIVPLFQIVTTFHLADTYAGMILPIVASTFGIFLLKGFFDTVPDSLRESSKCLSRSAPRFYRRISLCLKPKNLGGKINGI